MTGFDCDGHNTDWDIEGAIDTVAKRLEQIANRIEDLVSGSRGSETSDAHPLASQVDDDRGEAPSNPLRHWRWE